MALAIMKLVNLNHIVNENAKFVEVWCRLRDL